MTHGHEHQTFEQSATWRTDAEMLEERYKKVRAFLEAEGLGALIVYSPPAAHQWGQTGHVAFLSGWGNLDRMVDTVVLQRCYMRGCRSWRNRSPTCRR